jgi:hypothetical protein
MAATRPELRVGDAERDETATSLREHYAQGRLSTDELNERLDAVFTATTQGQLQQVTDDLPQIQPEPAAAAPAVARPRPGRVAAKAVTTLVVLAALLAVAITLHTGHHVSIIPELVIALLVLRALAGRTFGHHQHRHHQHVGRQHWDGQRRDRQHWDGQYWDGQRWHHGAARPSSQDDPEDARAEDRVEDPFEPFGRRRHEHHHEHYRSPNGGAFSHRYRYEYNYQYPRQSR